MVGGRPLPGGGDQGARVGAQEPEVAKEAPRRRAGIAHAEEAAVTLSAEDLEQPPPGRAHAHARPRHLAVSSPLPARCEPAGSRGVSVRDRARSASLPEKKTLSFLQKAVPILTTACTSTKDQHIPRK